ncbi:MAG: integrase arm-type DNA-binding domain-containing protein [Gammaproteobacteria bacterium]|nr:integrase arm-type DNA-binding domain-containing protein [Gammaproteobacteria bacterium]
MTETRRPKRSGAYWLSAAKVKTAKRGYHADGRGLYLVVQPSGTKSWTLRYMLNGRRRDMGLGPYPTIDLATARKKAEEQRALLVDQVDPLEARGKHRARKRATVLAAATALIESKQHGWRNAKHAAQWTSTLERYAFPTLGDLDVSQVDTDAVVNVLNPIWTEKPETASRVRQRIEAVLDYAIALEQRTGPNPARWRGHLDHLLPKVSKVKRVKHFPALPWAEMADFMALLRTQDGLGTQALEFTILTACRSGEVLGARWDEVDLVQKVWTIPAERMKANRPHRVPLPEDAVTLLEGLPRIEEEPYVFPGQKRGRPLSNMTLTSVLRRLGRTDITVHGFRSTFRDWAAEHTNYPRELAEAALAHVLDSKTEAAYQRGDLLERRRELMKAWAGWCTAA